MPSSSSPRRYVITGAPGAGKSTLLQLLGRRGYAVVDEAATDVIAREQARGNAEPWREESFIAAVAQLQHERQELPPPAGTAVQFFDRSPLCTVALARYSDRPVPPSLAIEVARVLAEGIYRPRVFFVRLLGFITPTAARRISYADSVRFERFHEQAYREHGFELVDVPPGPPEQRAELIARAVAGDG
ncbi:AAA family ATPase [Actinoplanes sp. NPDC048791]|uniref:AAA family ATPase n=1 Tax=Actinoplanes sp. NPDC048791 TaxID=3154623 RepID=UPI0033D45287